jgi:hypothetical protein
MSRLGWISMSMLFAFALACPPVSEAGEPDLWFPIGERLTYKIYWGFILVGESSATTRWIEEDGRRLLSIKFRTQTTSFMDRIYPVDDTIESIIDPVAFLPIRFTKKLSEGRYRADERTDFDHEKGVARWQSFLNGRTKEYEIGPDTRDLVSFMYFTRKERFKVGDERDYQVMADEKIYDLFVEVTKREKVKLVDGSRMKSLLIEPRAAFEGLFVRKGKMWLWISDTEQPVVTKLQAKVPVASVKLVLEEIGRVEVPERSAGSSGTN